MLITHIILGYPDEQNTLDIVNIMVKTGIKKIELQIPFSDPIADGATISNANTLALKNGMTTKSAIDLASIICSKYPEIEFYFMTYGNIIFNYGIEKFCKKASEISITGCIIPDFPLDCDEGKLLSTISKKYKLSNILVVSPSMDKEKVAPWLKESTGFVYLTSTKGSTGAKTSLQTGFQSEVAFIRACTNTPIGIGFGISKKEHVVEVLKFADYAIVGSRILNVFNESGLEAVDKELLMLQGKI